MPPKEFDDHVAQITQAQARAEEFTRRPIELPHDIPDLEGMRGQSTEGEARILDDPHGQSWED